MRDFMCVSAHAETLADGRQVGPRDEVSLSAEQERDERNARLFREGLLVPVTEDEPKEETETAAQKKKREAEEKAAAEKAAEEQKAAEAAASTSTGNGD